MGIGIIGLGLVYVLSLFFCVNSRELGIERRSTAEPKWANTHLFNVRRFGALADGHTDDKRVCSSSSLTTIII